jgi:AcrR family transcriptional regulator
LPVDGARDARVACARLRDETARITTLPERALSPSSREKILETAELLFARQGYAGLGMRELAIQVGLGKSSLFHHFASKAALWIAVLERVLGQIDARLETALSADGSGAERLERSVDALVDALAESPPRAPLLLRALFEPDGGRSPESAPLDATLDRILGRLGALIQAGRADGSLRDASTPHAIQTLIGMTVYHFASGEFGERLLGGSVFAAAEIERRKAELRAWLREGIAAPVRRRRNGNPS